MRAAVENRPERDARWLIGSGTVIEVYTVPSDPRVLATLLLLHGHGVMLMNRELEGTHREHAVLDWGLLLVADQVDGFYSLYRD